MALTNWVDYWQKKKSLVQQNQCEIYILDNRETDRKSDRHTDREKEIALRAGDSRRGMLRLAIKGAFTGLASSTRTQKKKKKKKKNKKKKNWNRTEEERKQGKIYRSTLPVVTQLFLLTADYVFHQSWFTLHSIVHHYAEQGIPAKDRALIIYPPLPPPNTISFFVSFFFFRGFPSFKFSFSKIHQTGELNYYVFVPFIGFLFRNWVWWEA